MRNIMSIISLSNSFDTNHIQIICNNSTPEILEQYFHKQTWLVDKDFTLLYEQQGKNRYCKKIMNFIESLKPELQEQLLFDFKIVSFFTNTTQLSEDKTLNKEDKSNFRFLLYYLKETNNQNIEFLPHLNLFDQTVHILTNFKEEFYECYTLYAHFEVNKTINTKAQNKLDLQLILQRLIIDKKFAPFIKSGSHIQGFYINQLILVNLCADNTEVSINAKHTWQNNKENTTDFFCRLLEQYNIRNPAHYNIKEMEIVAVINIPYINKNFRRSFIVNHKRETSLSFETIDEQIKECFKEYFMIRELYSLKQSNLFFFITGNYSSKFIFKN
jgi:hypothetical protein